MDDTIKAIARQLLGFRTLETRKSDSLDFRSCAVWCVKEALEQAWKAGYQAGKNDK